LCYKPRNCTDKQLEKKQSAFNSLRTTTHTPDKVKLFPTKPNCYNPANRPPSVNPISPPILTQLGKRLAGF
jgi:hypothetical protein